MKKMISRTIAIIGLLFALAVVGVQAQTPSRAEASVPFDFTAGRATLKAGSYSIKRLGNSLSIRTIDGKKTVLVNAPLAIGSRDQNGGARLVFNRYGDLYFLSQVWLTVDSGRQLFPSESESRAREFQLSKGVKPERVEVAVRGN
jgi:hypothetical protein